MMLQSFNLKLHIQHTRRKVSDIQLWIKMSPGKHSIGHWVCQNMDEDDEDELGKKPRIYTSRLWNEPKQLLVSKASAEDETDLSAPLTTSVKTKSRCGLYSDGSGRLKPQLKDVRPQRIRDSSGGLRAHPGRDRRVALSARAVSEAGNYTSS